MTKIAAKSPAESRRRRAVGTPPRMVRKQLLITPAQNLRLKALAAATGKSETELVREAIDAKLTVAGDVDWKVGLFAAIAEWPADSDIGERIAENRQRRAQRRKRLRSDGDA
jgi:predicted transcriptional regulator